MAFPVRPTPIQDRRLVKSPPKVPDPARLYRGLDPLPSDFWGSPVFTAESDGYMIKEGELFCPGYIGNTISKNIWDYVVISFPKSGVSNITPGICNVNVRRGRKVDRKKSQGSDGERLTFTGISNADIDIAITIWTPEQLRILQLLWNFIQPAVGKGNPQAFSVSHPQLRYSQVQSCVFVESSGLEPNGKMRTVTIKAIEYFPPKDKTVHTIKKVEPRDSTLQSGDAEHEQPGKNPKAVGPHHT